MRIPGRFLFMIAIGPALLSATGVAQIVQHSSVVSGGGTAATSGGLVMAGSIGQSLIGPVFNATNSLGQGFWYTLPQTSVLGVHNLPAVAGSAVMLYQNSPNPFSSETEIAFDLPTSGHVSLKLIDALGHEVSTLIDEEREAGRITTTLRAERMESGYYTARLVANGVTRTIRMVLVR